MNMTMEQKYHSIMQGLKEARESNNTSAIKRLRNKLTKWQLEYGAYSPITQANYNRYE